MSGSHNLVPTIRFCYLCFAYERHGTSKGYLYNICGISTIKKGYTSRMAQSLIVTFNAELCVTSVRSGKIAEGCARLVTLNPCRTVKMKSICQNLSFSGTIQWIWREIWPWYGPFSQQANQSRELTTKTIGISLTKLSLRLWKQTSHLSDTLWSLLCSKGA